MIDRAKLGEAIAVFQRRLAKAPAGYFEPHLIEQSKLIIAAAEAHMTTLPNTKMVDVWRLEWSVLSGGKWQPFVAHYESEVGARAQVERWTRDDVVRCVCLTGPHQQEVPA